VVVVVLVVSSVCVFVCDWQCEYVVINSCCVQVRAQTKAGHGPWSDVVHARTRESSE